MKKIIAVASGKGGVGKSTVAANLAVLFANNSIGGVSSQGKVALVDVDFYGPSIPTLMGGGEIVPNPQGKFIPALRYGVKYISIGFFLPNDDDPIIWRGPMLGKGIAQLFHDVDWGDVDLCFVDMPPGTGDAQLSLSQNFPLTGAVIVTTPQEVALADVRRAINMFRKVNVPVLGIVENMAGYRLPSGELVHIFGQGGGTSLADRYGIPLLGSIPLDVSVREGGDKGEPAALDVSQPSAQALLSVAVNLKTQLDAAQSGPSLLEVVN
jgi:ATP-binding protein involved in chromosome partitioning